MWPPPALRCREYSSVPVAHSLFSHVEEIISGIDSVNYSDIKTGDITRVYDINGKEIYSIPAASFNKDNVPGYGIFIVKTGSNVEKIIKLKK